MFAELLRRQLGSDVLVSSQQMEILEKHFELLRRWNNVLNLTSIRKTEEIVERHYCESLFLGAHLPAGKLKIVDVGSGAGFPGIPVAILRPDCTVALVESHQRKSVFLREATRDLRNTRVIVKKIEEVAENFDWGILRAVNYAQIERALGRIATSLAILGGTDSPGHHYFTWNEPIKLPWGERRNLWLGWQSST